MPDLLSATAPLMVPAFTLAGSDVSWLELLAMALSVWMVLCNLRVNPLGWPLAIAASALYGLLFAQSKLYGEATLQLVFIALAGWGWWQWLRGTTAEGAPLPVRRLDARGRWLALGATALGWPLLGWLLARTTDSDVPYLDALPTVGSVVGQYLLGRKWLENWPAWVAVNLVSLALFATKGLWLTVGLYALFALLAVAGWRAWGTVLRQQGSTQPGAAGA